MSVVLDASALLAVIEGEPGAETVEDALVNGAISAVNLSEVVAKLMDRGFGNEAVAARMNAFSLAVHAFDAAQAWRAGLLRRETRARGLSLGDRACLALAEALEAPAMTTDRAWAALGLDVEVTVVR